MSVVPGDCGVIEIEHLAGGDPTGDPWPMLLQGVVSHEKSDMAAGHGFLNDQICRRPEKPCRGKGLFGRRDIVGGARYQIGWAGDIAQVELAAKANESILGKPILLEELADYLEIPTPRQIDRVSNHLLKIFSLSR